MKITAIRQQVYRTNRYAIYIDGSYSFSLSDTALLEQKLVPGQELTAEELADLKATADEDKLYGLLLRYVALRKRSEWEVRTYLKQKNASPALMTKLLNKLSNNGWLDDEAFARAWIESRQLLKPSSRRKMLLELCAKHVSEAVIAKVLEAEEVDDRDNLRSLVVKKRRSAQYRDDTKLMAYLARQGFNYDDIRDALRAQDDA